MVRARTQLRRALAWIVERRHHLFFGASFILLAALVTWWAVFLRASEEERYRNQIKEIRLEARFFAGDDARLAVAVQNFYRSRVGSLATRNLARLRRRLRVRAVSDSFDASGL